MMRRTRTKDKVMASVTTITPTGFPTEIPTEVWRDDHSGYCGIDTMTYRASHWNLEVCKEAL